jgi:CHAD domain-containing protein
VDPRFAVEGVDAETPVDVAAPAILRAKSDPLFALEERAAGGQDMDAVHDMRVASRRLREALRLLEPFFPPKRYQTVFRSVRVITRTLGPVRDSDVFIDAFRGLIRWLPEGGRKAVAFFIGYRLGRRRAELATMRRSLSKLDLAQGRKSFERFASAPKHTKASARRLGDLAHEAVEQRLATVYGYLPAALSEDNIEAQHAMRIAVKQLRYAVEVFAPCYGEEFERLHATLTEMQDVLGDLHDLHVFLDLLHDRDVAKQARMAGVGKADLAEVTDLLRRRAHTKFVAFSKLVDRHPFEEIRAELIGPLDAPTKVAGA